MKKTFSWINPNLKVATAGKKGKGVYASKRIKKDELLAIFGGYIMSLKEESKLPQEIGDLAHQIHENFVIGICSKSQIQPVDFFNHSCDANAGFNGQIFLVAMRDIQAGEEVFFDYAMVLHKSKGVASYRMKCLCGSINCRGVITDLDWKNKALQKKYKGYFQYYIEKKINSL